MSGGGGGTTTVQKSDPWKQAQPYLTGGYAGGTTAPTVASSGFSGQAGTLGLATNTIQGQNQGQVPGTQVPGLLPEAARIYQQQAQVGPYEGQLTARPSAATKLGQAMTLGLAPTAGQQGQAISQYASDVLGGRYLDVNQNAALQGYMNAAIQPLQQQLLEDILPSIGAGAIQAGGYGGSRQGITEGKAISDYLQQAMNTRAAMAGQTYAQERQLQQQVPGVVQQGLQTQLLAPQLVGQVGQAQTAEQQALLDEAYARYQMQQQQPWQALGQYANIILPASGQGGTTTGTVQAAPNPLGGALGGAAAGASIGSVIPGVGTGVGAAIGGGLGFMSSLR